MNHTYIPQSSVYFEETSKLIPNNAVVIEIAPHGLLQAIVKRSHTSCEHVPLTKRGHENPNKFLLTAIGRYKMNFLMNAFLLSYNLSFGLIT